MNNNNNFYVYEHVRLDNNTCFYVGKGTGNRKNILYRNKHHDNISNKHGHAVVIIKDNLTESEAFELERDTIEDYVFNLGYGIDIDGYQNKENDEYLTNQTFGGEGASGLNPYYNKSEEEMKIIRQKMSKSSKGKMAGKNNPMYGKEPWNKGKKFSEEARKKMSKSGKGKHSKKVICITTGKIFNSIKEACNYYKCNHIHSCCKGKIKYAGKLSDGTKLQWCYLENYNNEYNGILINPIQN